MHASYAAAQHTCMHPDAVCCLLTCMHCMLHNAYRWSTVRMVILQVHLSIVGSDLGLEFPRKLDAAHPLRDAGHLLPEHLCILHLLARPLHHHHQTPTTESNRQQANNTVLETEVATVQTPKEISRRLGNSEDHGFAKIYCIRVGQRMRCKAGRAGQSSAGPAQHSTARHSAACYSEAADPTANSGGRRSTCSKLVMEPSRMPKNSTPVIWDISITARSALVMGRMSPNPMVETVVSDQYAAARYTSGPGMERAYMQST